MTKYLFNVQVDRVDTTPAMLGMMHISVCMTPFRKKGTYIKLYNAYVRVDWVDTTPAKLDMMHISVFMT